MSTKSGFLVIAGWLLIVAAGLFAIVAMAWPEYASGMADSFIGMEQGVFLKWLILLAGASLVILAFVLPFTGYNGGRGNKPIEFTSEVGSMIIEASALEDCLRRTALEDEDVTDASANIRVPEMGQDRPIVCSVRISIRELPDIPGRGSKIAKRIQERFLEILPMDTPPIVNLDRISIQRPKPVVTRTFTGVGGELTEISPGDLPEIPVSLESDEAAEKSGSFTGVVQYPVEEEQGGSGEGRG